MGTLFALSLIIFLLGCAMLLVSHRDISRGVSIETNKKIFKISGITTLVSALIFVCLFSIAFLNGSSGNRCDICNKPATHSFQGYGYCDEHYQQAVIWAFDNVNED